MVEFRPLTTFNFRVYDDEGGIYAKFRIEKHSQRLARLAAKLGLLLTEPKVRSAIANQVRDRADAVTDTIADKYEDALDRLEAAGAALQGRTYCPHASRAFYWA